MKINFQCANCSQIYSIDSKHGGKLFRCKACETQLRIPVTNPTSQSLRTPESPAGTTDLDIPQGEFPAVVNQLLVKHLKYQRAATIPEIQRDLERLRTFDKHHEKRQSFHLKLMAMLIPVSLILVFVTGLLFVRGSGSLSWLCAIAAVTSVAGAIFVVVKYSQHKRLNLEDKRYECLNEFLRLIAVDANQNQTFNASLVFGKHNRKETFVRAGKVGRWDVKYYVNDWFTVSGRLKDGSRFSISIREKQQDRSRWKHKKGNAKLKSKVKNSEEISLIIRPKEKRYPDLVKLVPDAPKSLQIPEYAELKSFSFQQQAIVLRLAIRGSCIWKSSLQGNQSINRQVKERVNLLAMMLLSVYQMLNLSRELQKNAGS